MGSPKEAFAYYSRGRAWGRKGEHGRAVADLTEAIRRNPRLAQAYHNRGVAFEKKGQKARAEQDFARAEKLTKEAGSGRR